MNRPARIAILIETPQEFQILKRHLGRLADWEVPYELTMVSALRSRDRLARWIAERERQGVEVFLAAVGGSAALAGAVAALTDHPVIGVPLDTTHFRGQDALQAMATLPAGVPVGIMGINGLENALYFALRIVALRHPEYGSLLQRLRIELEHKEAELLANLRDQYPEIFSGEPAAGRPSGTRPESEITAEVETAPRSSRADEAEVQPPGTQGSEAPRRRGTRRLVVDPEQPDVATVEEVADLLLGGGIVALPTDTVYGLAALATNAAAVRRLYEIKEREPNKPIPLLIDSIRGLPQLVREIPESVEALVESLWPGALTLVFKKYRGAFAAVSRDETIGLRMPDHYVTLAVISTVARPLAVTSANRSGQAPYLTADEVMDAFADSIDCVLDAGRMPGERVSTVLSVVESPFRILREGEVSAGRLREILGDELVE